MKDIEKTLRLAPREQEEQEQFHFSSFDPPSHDEMEGIRKHQSLQAVYRWMLEDFSSRMGGITDKQMAAQLGMDTGYFSRVMQGGANFTNEKELRFMSICGRGDPVFWRTYWMGLDPCWLRPLESEAERRIRELEEENERLRHAQGILTRAIRGEV